MHGLKNKAVAPASSAGKQSHAATKIQEAKKEDKSLRAKDVADYLRKAQQFLSRYRGPEGEDIYTANLQRGLRMPSPPNPNGIRFNTLPVEMTVRQTVSVPGSSTYWFWITPQGFVNSSPINYTNTMTPGPVTVTGAISGVPGFVGLVDYVEASNPSAYVNTYLTNQLSTLALTSTLPGESIDMSLQSSNCTDYAYSFMGGKLDCRVGVPGNGSGVVYLGSASGTRNYGQQNGYEQLPFVNPNRAYIPNPGTFYATGSYAPNSTYYPYVSPGSNFGLPDLQSFDLVGTSGMSSLSFGTVLTPTVPAFSFSSDAGPTPAPPGSFEFNLLGNTTQVQDVGMGFFGVQNSGTDPVAVSIDALMTFHVRVTDRAGAIYDASIRQSKHDPQRNLEPTFSAAYDSKPGPVGQMSHTSAVAAASNVGIPVVSKAPDITDKTEKQARWEKFLGYDPNAPPKEPMYSANTASAIGSIPILGSAASSVYDIVTGGPGSGSVVDNVVHVLKGTGETFLSAMEFVLPFL